MRPRQALVGSTVFFFAVPGIVAGALPWVIGSSAGSPPGWPVRTVGLALAVAGVALLLVCFAGFVAARGSPRAAVPAWIPRVRPWPGPEVEVSQERPV